MQPRMLSLLKNIKLTNALLIIPIIMTICLLINTPITTGYTADGYTGVDLVLTDAYVADSYTSVSLILQKPTADSCTAPAINNDWELDSSDNCIITDQDIDLGTGNVYFIGNGNISFSNSNLTAQKFQRKDGDGGAMTYINIIDNSLITLKI